MLGHTKEQEATVTAYIDNTLKEALSNLEYAEQGYKKVGTWYGITMSALLLVDASNRLGVATGLLLAMAFEKYDVKENTPYQDKIAAFDKYVSDIGLSPVLNKISVGIDSLKHSIDSTVKQHRGS